jgi:hypothetical protein
MEQRRDRPQLYGMMMRSHWLALAALLVSATGVAAQIPPRTYTPPAPNLNPSSPLVLPQQNEVPVSPASPGSVFSTGHYLAGTNQVVNPPRSVFHAHRRRHRYVQ